MAPVDPPLQRTFVIAVLPLRITGCVIVTEVRAVHPLASVTFTVYVPALRPVAVTVV